MAPTFNGISLAAADMATTLTFYRRLGLDLPAELDSEPHAEATGPGGVRLMWDSHASLRELGLADEIPPGGTSLAFLCADAAEVDRVYADMVAAGHHGEREPWDAVWGQRYAVLRDPDGNTVDLFAWVSPAPS